MFLLWWYHGFLRKNTCKTSCRLLRLTCLHATNGVSNPGSNKQFFSSSKYQDQLWCPPILLFNGCGCRSSFLGKSCQSMKLTTHLQVVTRLRKSGAIPVFPPHVFMARAGKALPFTFCHMAQYFFASYLPSQGCH
jgi:hypothetical protein